MDQDVSAVVNMMLDTYGVEETINTLLGGDLMNFITINVTGLKNNRTRLGTMYGSVRSFMHTNYLAFAGGYIIPHDAVEECMTNLGLYKSRWIREGGESEDFTIMNFEIQCDNQETYRLFKRTLRDAVNERLTKTLKGFRAKTLKYNGYGWAKDVRCFKSLKLDLEYIKKYSILYNVIADIAAEVGSIMADFREHPESCIRRLEAVIENN